jgi:hypothetical protein
VDGGMGGFAEWVDGVMGLWVGFINKYDMYNNDVGKGVVYAYEMGDSMDPGSRPGSKV